MAFPDNPKIFVRAIDPQNQNDIENINAYQAQLAQGNFTEAQNILSSMANGIQMNINAGRYNEVIEEIEQIEQFYLGLNGVKQYIQENIDAFSNIAVWNSSTNYKIGNIASSNGEWFICITENINIEPKVNENWQNYWSIFIKHQVQYPISSTQPENQQVGDIWFQLLNID